MQKQHYILSASKAPQWFECQLFPRFSSEQRSVMEATAIGSVVHAVSEDCLLDKGDAHRWLNKVVTQDGYTIVITDEMVGWAQYYIDVVRYMAHGSPILVEYKVPISQITGETDATSAADAIILLGDERELVIIDLKTGRLRVDAEGNKQLLMLGLGALEAFGGNWCDRVRMVIIQPSISSVSEWVQTVDDMLNHEVELSRAAAIASADEVPPGKPGEKQCRYCPGKVHCSDLKDYVFELVEEYL